MKKILIITILTVLFISNLFSLELDRGNIAGRIIDENTQKPVENVSISIEGKIFGVSDENGRYLIKSISKGKHNINFSRFGYATRTKLNFAIIPDQTSVLNIKLRIESFEMEGISVIEETYFRETTDAPVSSKTLDIEEIKSQPAGSYDIQRAIQALPAVVSGTDSENEIIVRGGNYGENLFIIDNIELSNPNHFAIPGTGGGPISMITPEFVEEIDFYAGAFPAKYGDKASSVMNITTRNGDENRFKAKLDMGMSGYGGNMEGPLLSKKGNFIFSYHRSFMSLISESIGLAAVPYYQSIFGKQVINFSPQKQLTITQLWGSDKITIEHQSTGYSQGEGENDIYSRSGQYSIGATYKNIYQNSYSLLTVYRNQNWWKHDLYEAGYKTNDRLNITYHANESNNALKYSLKFPTTFLGRIELGFSGKLDISDIDSYKKPDTLYVYDISADEVVIIDTLKDEFGNPRYIGSLDHKINDISTYKVGTYLQWENKIGKFTFNQGLRYDYFVYTSKGTISPRFGVKYGWNKKTNLSFGIGRHYQNPGYLTLNYDDRNKELKPKFTDQIVLGFDRLLSEDIKLTIETYYKKYKDVPLEYAATTPDSLDWESYSINAGTGYAKGLEFFLQKKVKDNFWGTLSYSYSIAKADDPRYPEEDKEYSWDFDFRHVFTGILGYKFEFMKYEWFENNRNWLKFVSWMYIFPSDEVEISLKYRYLGGKPYTEPEYKPELRMWLVSGNQEYNTKRYPAYQRLDLHIQHRWYEKKVNIISYLEIDNIVNTKNIWDYNYLDDGSRESFYQWGRMIVGGVVVEF